MSETTSQIGGAITVLGLEDSEDRGIFFSREEARYQRREIPTQELADRFSRFVESLRDVVAAAPKTLGDFALEEVTLSAEVSAKGTVSLLGTGGELGGQSGITLTLRRN